MDDASSTISEPHENASPRSWAKTVWSLTEGESAERLPTLFVLLNIFFLLARPQYTFPILGQAKITILVFFIATALGLMHWQRAWNRTTKLLLIFLAIHAVFIVIGRFVFDDFIMNDGRAFYAYRGIVQLILCFLLPVATYLHTARQFRMLAFLCSLVGAYLGIYSLRSGGTGPGDYVLDENDLASALILFLPFSLTLYLAGAHGLKKLFFLICGAVTVLGAVVTLSRGGFVGMVMAFLYLLTKAPRKLPLIAGVVTLLLVTIPFIPKSYYSEVESISADTGTGLERLGLWRATLHMWLDPKHFITGVGFENTPYNMYEYLEEGAKYGLRANTVAGKEVHSVYMQTVGDTGLVGLLYIGSMIIFAFRGNTRSMKGALQARHIISAELERRLTARENNKTEQVPAVSDLDEQAMQFFLHELQFMQYFTLALNVSWVGLFGTGAFLSILYYPSIWMLLVLSACAEQWWRRSRFELEQLFAGQP